MKKIINWLREIEHIANQVYEQAALIFEHDRKFKRFFKHMAEDEAWHYHVMSSALEFLRSSKDIPSAILIDTTIDKKIKSCFSDIKTSLGAENINKAELLEKIIKVELSEWNDIFFYVLDFLKEKTDEFKYPAARIQAHLKEIEIFIESLEIEGWKAIQTRIKEVPPVWVENILIVDDDEAIADLLKALLSKLGNIDIVHNGKDAIECMETKFYKLIVSDVDMPIMDGIAFYKEALDKFPNMNKRFLFLTGDLSSERKNFFNMQGTKYLSKPSGITELQEIANKIILSK